LNAVVEDGVPEAVVVLQQVGAELHLLLVVGVAADLELANLEEKNLVKQF
jgi:hypothetical protein